MKHDYEDIVSMLTLPETIAHSLYCCLGEVKHQVDNNRVCTIVSGSVSMLHNVFIIHASYSIPILSPFAFIPSALLFVIHRIFYLLISTHFYNGCHGND